MLFGVSIFATEYTIGVVDVGRAAEEHGFESLWLPEHTHIPSKRVTPWPSGGDLPREYAHTLDPFVALGAVAAATSRIKIGTGVCLVIEHEPISLAKTVASLDVISGGRFLFGVGAGWLREEIANHGVDPRTRWKLFGEQMQAMTAIWTTEEAEFHGRFVDFEPIWSWPKPVQKPRPPVLLGGDVPAAMQRVIDYADEWMPHPDRGGALGPRLEEFWQLCEAAGRGRMPVTLYGVPMDARLVAEYQALGVSRCIFRLPPASAQEVLPALKRATELTRQLT